MTGSTRQPPADGRGDLPVAPTRPYPTYKPSGVPWLGDVPEHWEVRRLGDSVVRCINGTWGDEPDGVNDLPCIRVADFDRVNWKVRTDKLTMRAVTQSERSRRMLHRGDLLLEKSGGGDNQPVGAIVLYDHDVEAVCSNFVGKLEVKEGYQPEYLTYLHATLYALQINKRSIKQTTGIQNIDADSYLSEPIAFPPLAEQAAIARYLDHADRRIRRYVSAKRKLIGLLEEEKQAVIHRAVTRGLDPNVRLKPSGVEWLGDVPEHWEVRRLKTICSMKSGDGITAEAIEANGDFPVYGGNGLRGYTSRYTHDGEFALIGRQGALCGNVHTVDGKFWASEHAVIATLYTGYDVNWFGAILTSMNLNQYSISAAQPGLAVERVLNLFLPVPPKREQKRIANHIGESASRIDSAITHARRQIELLEEYRTRLIADVVTGKLDVREAAAQLPEEADEYNDDDEPVEELARDMEGRK